MESILRKAVEEGRVEDAARLFDEGHTVDWERETLHDLPLLHMSAERGDAAMIRLLLDQGGATVIDDFDDRGVTPLMLAAHGGATDVMAELLRHGAGVNAADERHGGETALLQAIVGGDPGAVKILVDAGADPTMVGAGPHRMRAIA